MLDEPENNHNKVKQPNQKKQDSNKICYFTATESSNSIAVTKSIL